VLFEVAVFSGEVAYAAGITQLNQAKPDFAKVAANFARAITLNPYRDVYYLSYGQNLIFQASEEAAKPKPNVNQVQTWMADTVNAGRSATTISPGKAANWSALAQFYIGIRPLVDGTDKFIIDSWQQAITRDPKNPSLYVQLASAESTASETIDPAIAGTGTDTDKDGLSDTMETRLGSDPKNPDSNNNGVSDGDEAKAGFNPAGTGRLSPDILASFTKIDQSMVKSSEDALNKAIELKPDLPDSYIALARILEKDNKADQAKKQLDDAIKQYPAFQNNADVLFEQGRLTFNAKDYAAAEKIFNNVIALVPNHANAMYSLGLIYQQRGDKDQALAEFEKVREITGPNVDLEKLINSLKNSASTPSPSPASSKNPAPTPTPSPASTP
jgi:tetratricopeptide (TPR) repeat protein